MFKLSSIAIVLALGHAMAASEPANLRAPRELGGDCNKCKSNDPCGKDESGYYEHCSKKKFIQCSNGGCYEFLCAGDTVWDQDELACIFPKMKPGDSCGGCENPCTKKNIKAGMYYHPHCEKSKKYLQCAGVGMCYAMTCGSGTKWDQESMTCVMKK